MAKSSTKSAKKLKTTLADGADKYALYRLSVQDPEHEVSMFRRFYKDAFGREATSLREDFCAAFAVCCEWVKTGKDRVAIGVDLDDEPLSYGRTHYLSKLAPEQQERITLQKQDVMTTTTKAEIIAAQNYSFYIFKRREEVLRYFKQVRLSLADEGCFVFDMMGGSAMYADDVVEGRQVARPTAKDKLDNPPFRYVWHQVSFDPVSADALFHIHFRFPDGSALEKAFTYDWRLWTLPELLELLDEAGFSARHVYWETDDKDGNPSGNYRRSTRGHADPAWLCYVVALK
ncbi:MAG: class I SAM-dependent methyltransferase [Deltaproteobacteria bacterium]|nr:class I SAM-dependent methyltransferase [Deltaproteobacteria bacterium]